jgi:single-strand DNA-binding protein
MNSINRVVLLGQMTRQPRLSHLPSGKTVCDFGLALHRRWLDLNGDAQQETTFVDVTAWNQQAEVIGEYCRPGRPIAVEGRLEQERWESPTGEKRSRLRVVAQRVTFLSRTDGTAPEAEPFPDWMAEVLSDAPGH